VAVDREKVLGAFLRDGRLVSLPARAGKRRVVLDHVVSAFEPGVRMREPEVDAVLRDFYAYDWVSLRRYLVDEGLLTRRDGWYWRTGGPPGQL
jgi:hypothetical protein